MSKLASISANPVHQEYAQGAAQSAVSRIADFLAPTVEVSTLTGRYKAFDENHRFKIPETLRELGGQATRLSWSAKDKTYNCAPHAIDVPVDNLEEIEGEGLVKVFQESADMAAEIGALSHERRVIQAALAELDSPTALDIRASDDIIDQIDGAILEVIKGAKLGGLVDTRILLGAGAWRKVKNHPSVRLRTPGGKTDFKSISLDQFTELTIGASEARVTLLVADEAAEGLDEDIQFLLNGDIIVFAAKATPTRRDPSFMKTFRLRNEWMKPGSYELEDGRGNVAKFDWTSDVQVTNPLAAKRFSVALS